MYEHRLFIYNDVVYVAENYGNHDILWVGKHGGSLKEVLPDQSTPLTVREWLNRRMEKSNEVSSIVD